MPVCLAFHGVEDLSDLLLKGCLYTFCVLLYKDVVGRDRAGLMLNVVFVKDNVDSAVIVRGELKPVTV